MKFQYTWPLLSLSAAFNLIKKIKSTTITIFVACILGASSSIAYATSELGVTPMDPPSYAWPFTMLTYAERVARLDFFINIKDLAFYERSSTQSKKICDDLLQDLKDKEYKILKPQYSFPIKNDKENIAFPRCVNRIDTYYIHGSAQDADHFQRATSLYNREYYDLSEFLGQNIWGFFAEGGRLECGKEVKQICQPFNKGYGGGYASGAIFNSNDCTTLVGQPFIFSRLELLNDERTQYREAASFNAFIQLRENIYRLVFDIPWLGGWSELLSPGFATLILTSSKEDKCVFSAP